MQQIEFMTPVLPLPGEAGAPKILMLVPDLNGGIRSLFQQMQHAGCAASRTHLTLFASHDAGPNSQLRLPGKLLEFRRKLKSDATGLCHINLSIRGSTLRKLLYANQCSREGVPYVLHLHGGRYREFYRHTPLVARSMITRLFHRAAKVIVLGSVWRDFVVDEIGVPADRVVILPNAVSGPPSAPEHGAHEKPTLLFLGRLGPQKGAPELLTALASPGMQTLLWHATFAGDGDVELYRTRARELRLADRIDFPGWVDGGQVAALLTRANILVLPSHAENLPLAMLEGMGYGLCPVVTPVGAVPDVIVDGENGLLVPAKDASALAQTLARVCADGTLRATIARRARSDFLARYDIKNYRAQLEAIYLDVLNRQ